MGIGGHQVELKQKECIIRESKKGQVCIFDLFTSISMGFEFKEIPNF